MRNFSLETQREAGTMGWYLLWSRRSCLGRLLFLPALLGKGRGPLSGHIRLLLELHLLVCLAIHIGDPKSFDQQVRLIHPSCLVVGIELDCGLRLLEALNHAALYLIKILLLSWLLESYLCRATLGRSLLHVREFRDLKRAIPIFPGENGVRVGALFAADAGVVGPLHDPVAQVLLVLSESVKHGYRFVGFLIGRISLQDLLVGLDRLLGFGDIVRGINALLVLLVNDTRNENGSGRVIGIEVQRALRVRFGFLDVSVPVGLGGIVKLALRSYLIDDRAACAGHDKQSQDRCRGDPGLRESHFRLAPFSSEDDAAIFHRHESDPGGGTTGSYRHSFYYGRSSTCKATGLAPAPLIGSMSLTTSP